MKGNLIRTLVVGIAVVGLAITAPLAQETMVETFDEGSNHGGWSFGRPTETIETTGGNPGAFLAVYDLFTFAPRPYATWGGNFVGDYRDRGVTYFGIDLITLGNAWSTGGRPLTLMLIHNNGTDDYMDDTAAFYMGPNIPHVGEGWVSYDYDIPSQETELPAGWELLNMGDSGAPAIHTWDQVIQDVTEIRMFYGDPRWFFIFQGWALGMDNVRITFIEPAGSFVMCHNPTDQRNRQTMDVTVSAVQSHLDHGDHMGPCDNSLKGIGTPR
jgi:hypothetical protein